MSVAAKILARLGMIQVAKERCYAVLDISVSNSNSGSTTLITATEFKMLMIRIKCGCQNQSSLVQRLGIHFGGCIIM